MGMMLYYSYNIFCPLAFLPINYTVKTVSIAFSPILSLPSVNLPEPHMLDPAIRSSAISELNERKTEVLPQVLRVPVNINKYVRDELKGG